MNTLLAKLAIGLFLILDVLAGDHTILLWQKLCFPVKEKLYLQE